MHELPLLIFTLLIQGSVGLTIFLSLRQMVTARREVPSQSVLPALLTACIAGGIGLIASTLHLGYPANAIHALRHFSDSWLSREIVFTSLYLAVLALCAFTVLIKKRPYGIMLLLASTVGIIDIFCMSAVYAHSSVATWTHVNTFLMFYGSVGILGAVAAACLFKGKSEDLRSCAIIRYAAIVVALIVLTRLIAQPAYVSWLNDVGNSGVVTLSHPSLEAFKRLNCLYLAGWILSAFGSLLFVVGALRATKSAIFSGVLLLAAAEIALRLVFFTIG